MSMSSDEHWIMKIKAIGFFMPLFKWTPVLIILAITSWSYYAYVMELCVYNKANLINMILLLSFYHITLILFVWSYWKTIITSLVHIPDQWRIPDEEVNHLLHADNLETRDQILNSFARNLQVKNRTESGSMRFCEKCKIIKPDRAHHCRICRCCVLKMDHHCVWVNNCVNFHNYKYFVLFVGYALIMCVYIASTSLRDFLQYFRGEVNFHILFLFFTAVMFALSLVSLFFYHIYLVLVNRTTLESSRAPTFPVGGANKHAYNVNWYANFCEVFGHDWKYWFLPVYTSQGDGFNFPTAIDLDYDSTASRIDVHPTDALIDIESSLNKHYHSALLSHSKDVSTTVSHNTDRLPI